MTRHSSTPGSEAPDESRTLTLVDEVPERAMVVAAHPDDAEIGPGATVGKWTSLGCEVFYVVCTTGGGGSNDRGMTADRLIDLRAREQLEAARSLGVSDIVILDHPDGGLEDTREFRGEIVRAIRKYRPHTVFSHDPYRMQGFQHRDHRITAFAAMDAVYPLARDHLHYPEHIEEEGLEPHKVRHLMMWGTDRPDVIVDVTESVESQIAALAKHASQVQGLAPEGRVGTRLRERAEAAARAYPFKYGQTFRRLEARG